MLSLFFPFYSHMRVARDVRRVVLILNKRCSCVYKGWSWNYQCKVTWDNGACVSLKTQLKHMCTHVNTCLCMHMQAHACTQWETQCSSPHTRTHTHTYTYQAIVSNLVQVVQSIRPRTSLHSTLLGLKDATFVCFSWYLCHFKVQTKRLDHVQETGSLPLEQRNQGSTLPSCEKKKGRLTSRSIRQIMADLPA